MSSRLIFRSLTSVINGSSRAISTLSSAQATLRSTQHVASRAPVLWRTAQATWTASGVAVSLLTGYQRRSLSTQPGMSSSRNQDMEQILQHSARLEQDEKRRKWTSIYYFCAIGVFMVGMSYAGVPLYRMFCQSAGLGGQAVQGHDAEMVETMIPAKDRLINIRFNADISSSMQWKFRPQQPEITVAPGETALAFYTATNPTDKPIIGISTYNVVPYEAGQYFNKIQCFCFEEQILNPKEQVDMPVFFFIDPAYATDPKLETVDQITLSYTFFEARDGLELPQPAFLR